MDCQYTSREQWRSIWTASTPVESSGALYGLPVHHQRVVDFCSDCQYTTRQWSSIVTASTPVESSEFYTDCPYTSREQWSSKWTASTPVQSTGVLYGLPVHQQRVVEFYMDCQYTSREQWSSKGLPVHQQREVEFYMDYKYTSREQQNCIWTASTPVESSGVVY